jgi:hypothetical protein
MRRILIVVLSTLTIILLGITFIEGLSAAANTTSSAPVESGTINLQIQAVEVTQGVRGKIPARVPPNAELVLPSDQAVHIADRRTIVRVYPWVKHSSDVLVAPVTARLWVYREGALLSESPIEPQNIYLENISPDWDLDTMRSDAQKSWNFLLPSTWTASHPDTGPFTLRLVVEINPPGVDHVPECEACSADNQVILTDQEFVTVPALVIQPYFVHHTVTDRDGSQIEYPGPSLDEFQMVMKIVHSMLPVGDFGRGLNILDPIDVEWQGLLYQDGRHIFAEAMIERHFPGGSLRGNKGGPIHLFVFSADGKHRFLVNYNQDGMRLPLAWTGWPYAQSGMRPLELVHELTHTLGLSHAGDAYGETTSNLDYPDPTGRVEWNAYGFDVWEMQPIPPLTRRLRDNNSYVH